MVPLTFNIDKHAEEFSIVAKPDLINVDMSKVAVFFWLITMFPQHYTNNFLINAKFFFFSIGSRNI